MTNRSCRASAIVVREISSSTVLEILRSTSIIVASSSPIPTTTDWCSCRRSISRSCSRSAVRRDHNLASLYIHQVLRSIMIDIESSSRTEITTECKYCRRSMARFGSVGKQPGQFFYPAGVCVDNQGRIIVADFDNHRLQSFTHEGHHISSLDCAGANPFGVAFDEHRGLIAFSAGNRVHVIGANQWLADTFTWRPDLHRYAPSWMKEAVSTMTMIRSVVDESSAMSMIPNELLFEIFSFL